MSRYKAKNQQNRPEKYPKDPWLELAKAVCLVAHADRRRAEKAIREGKKYIPMKGNTGPSLATDVLEEVNEFFTPTPPKPKKHKSPPNRQA